MRNASEAEAIVYLKRPLGEGITSSKRMKNAFMVIKRDGLWVKLMLTANIFAGESLVQGRS